MKKKIPCVGKGNMQDDRERRPLEIIEGKKQMATDESERVMKGGVRGELSDK